MNVNRLKKVLLLAFVSLVSYNGFAQSHECKSIVFIDEFKAEKKVEKLFSDTCNAHTPDFLKENFKDYLYNESCPKDSSVSNVSYEVILKKAYYYPLPYVVSVHTIYEVNKFINGEKVATQEIEGEQTGPNWWGMRRASRLLIGKSNYNALLKVKDFIDNGSKGKTESE